MENKAKAGKINLPAHVYRKTADHGITRPTILGVVIHGRKIENNPDYFDAFLLLGYVVVLHRKRVITAFYDGERK